MTESLLSAARRLTAARARLALAVQAEADAQDAFDEAGTEEALAALFEAEDRVRVARAWVGRAERLRARCLPSSGEEPDEDPASEMWVARRIVARLADAPRTSDLDEVVRWIARNIVEVRRERAEELARRGRG